MPIYRSRSYIQNVSDSKQLCRLGGWDNQNMIEILFQVTQSDMCLIVFMFFDSVGFVYLNDVVC